MSESRPTATSTLHFAWFASVAAVLVLLLADLLPGASRLATPGRLFLCFAQVQLFFFVFVWPELRGTIPALALLLGFGLPPALVCANVSDTPPAVVLATEALAAAWGLLGAVPVGCRILAAARVAGALALSALPPLAVFVARGSPAVGWVSPFGATGSSRLLPIGLQAAVVAAAALVLLLLARRRAAA